MKKNFKMASLILAALVAVTSVCFASGEEAPVTISSEENLTMYNDIAPEHYAYKAIMELSARGFISGDGSGNIQPDALINRQETAKLAVSVNNIDVQKDLPLNCTDAHQVADWAKDIVAVSVKEGIINGYDDGTVRPLNSVTREEFVAIAMRSLGFQTSNSATTYSDVSADRWSAKYISVAKQFAFISGYEDGTFRPDQPITRAEAFTIYYKVLKFRDALTAASAGK